MTKKAVKKTADADKKPGESLVMRDKPPVPSAAQQQIFTEMTKPLQKIALELLHQTHTMAVVDITGRYHIGLRVRELLADSAAYGDNVIESLSGFLSMSPSTLYDCRNLVVAYTFEQVESLVRRIGIDGTRISFSHLQHLASLRGPDSLALRSDLEEAVFTKGLSSRDLAARIKDALGKRSHGGSAMPLPKSIGARLVFIEKTITKFNTTAQALGRGVLDDVRQQDLPEEKTIKQLRNTYASLTRASEQIRFLRDDLSEAMDILQPAEDTATEEPGE